jgi:beta-exotoxin I transport system permease protein
VSRATAELLSRGLRDNRRGLIAWCIGVAAYVVLLSAIFPSIKGAPELDKLIESYPDALKSLLGLSENADISSGAGYIDAELFSFMLPLFALVLAIGAGARTLAGEEESGRLELVFAYPVRRRNVVLAKGAAVGLEVAGFCASAFAALALASPVFGLDLSFGRLAAGLTGVGLLGLLHGWIALAVGAAVPSRALAIGVSAALAAGAYLVAGLHGLAGWLDPFRVLSSFWWIGQAPLQQGVDGWGLLVIAAAAAAALGLGAVLIGRRDLASP